MIPVRSITEEGARWWFCIATWLQVTSTRFFPKIVVWWNAKSKASGQGPAGASAQGSPLSQGARLSNKQNMWVLQILKEGNENAY